MEFNNGIPEIVLTAECVQKFKEIYGPDRKGVCSIDFAYPKFKEMYKDFKDSWEIINQDIN